MEDREMFDVAIIGGGLAGLSLAILSADRGYRTVLFEKEDYPYHKVCGEYISMESWSFLQRLGLNLEELDLPLINKLNISDSYGRLHHFALPLGGFGISRYTLDNSLFKLAISKGVEVRTNTKVNDVKLAGNLFQIKAGSAEVEAKVAAGSYGKRSNLDVKWNRDFILKKPNPLNNYIGVKYHIRYNHNRHEIALHNFYNGYCGMSKIEDDKSCLCYLTTADNLRNCNNSIEQLQKQILYQNLQLKQIFSTADVLYDQPLVISQISFDKKSQVEGGVLMLGDSAGLITPLCGNGMSMALHSAKIAFESVNGYLNGVSNRNEMQAAYTKAWIKNFSTRLQMGRAVQRFFGGKTSTSLFLRFMSYMPPVAKQIIRCTHGEAF